MQLNITDVRVVPGDSGFLIDTSKTTLLFDSGFAFTGEVLAKRPTCPMCARYIPRMPTGSTPGS